jgi:hypothetical protein
MPASDPRRPATIAGLLRLTVRAADGTAIGRIHDVRLARTADDPAPWAETEIAAIIVDDRRAGSLLGYDRREQHGPALLRIIVRAAHRQIRIFAITQIELDSEESGAIHARLR